MSDVDLTTPEEHAANTARLKAEAQKAKAEAAKFEAEAREAAARAAKEELAARKAEDEDQARRAGDPFHQVYRFSTEVHSNSVGMAMSRLTEWHRLHPESDIEIIFSSPGGSIFDGMELFDFLRDLSGKGHRVTTGGMGMAASMAGILVQAGDHRWLSKECWLLIHRASFMTWGSTYEIEDQVKLIKRIEDRIIDIFCSRSELTPQKIRKNWERRDWWLTADECKELGLIDEIRGSLP